VYYLPLWWNGALKLILYIRFWLYGFEGHSQMVVAIKMSRSVLSPTIRCNSHSIIVHNQPLIISFEKPFLQWPRILMEIDLAFTDLFWRIMPGPFKKKMALISPHPNAHMIGVYQMDQFLFRVKKIPNSDQVFYSGYSGELCQGRI
jgi:hypothetical protein